MYLTAVIEILHISEVLADQVDKIQKFESSKVSHFCWMQPCTQQHLLPCTRFYLLEVVNITQTNLPIPLGRSVLASRPLPQRTQAPLTSRGSVPLPHVIRTVIRQRALRILRIELVEHTLTPTEILVISW